MRTKFFKNIKKTQKDDKKLLIVILAAEAELATGIHKIEMQGLPIIHALSHARKHQKATAVMLSPSGEIFDLATISIRNQLMLVSAQKTRTGENYLESALMQLKEETEKLSEDDKFDQVLIIGGEPEKIQLTEAASKKLYEFNKLNMKDEGIIRIQICNFANKKILGTEILHFAPM